MHESTHLSPLEVVMMIFACHIQGKEDELSFLTHHLLLKFHIQLFNHSTQIHMKQRHYVCVWMKDLHGLTYFPFLLVL